MLVQRYSHEQVAVQSFQVVHFTHALGFKRPAAQLTGARVVGGNPKCAWYARLLKQGVDIGALGAHALQLKAAGYGHAYLRYGPQLGIKLLKKKVGLS